MNWSKFCEYRGIEILYGSLSEKSTFMCAVRGCTVYRESYEDIVMDIDLILNDPYIFWEDKSRVMMMRAQHKIDVPQGCN